MAAEFLFPEVTKARQDRLPIRALDILCDVPKRMPLPI
jgi:hypothetical protein